MSVLPRLDVDTAFVQFLDTNLPAGITVYYGHVPADAAMPYVAVYGVRGGDTFGPPLTAPDVDAQLIYQTTCVGGTPAQAMWTDDKVRQLILGRTPTGAFNTDLTVSGMSIADRESIDGLGAPELTGSLWQTSPRWGIRITPN